MRLTSAQFDALYQSHRLVLSLIGMSNVGKTFWGKRLSQIGFQPINCDDEIEKKLSPELKALGYQGIADVAAWMGQPYEPQSKKNQQEYLRHEKAVIQEQLKRFKNPVQNTVLDTTGSVIYTGEDLCRALKKVSLIVWIESTPAMKQKMLSIFFEHPKPVLWGDLYQPQPHETETETLRRCYPKLLDYRIKEYARFADVVIPYQFLDKNITGEELLKRIKAHL